MSSTRQLLSSCGKALSKVRKFAGFRSNKNMHRGDDHGEAEHEEALEIQNGFDDDFEQVLACICTSQDDKYQDDTESMVLRYACQFLDFFETVSGKQKGQPMRLECASNLLTRLYKNSGAHHSIILVALIYLQRLHDAGVVLNSSKINSYILVTLMTAAKVFEDECPPISTWAQVGLQSVDQVKAFELRFLTAVRFRCFVSTEQFVEMARDLLEFHASPDHVSSRLTMRFRFALSAAQPQQCAAACACCYLPTASRDVPSALAHSSHQRSKLDIDRASGSPAKGRSFLPEADRRLRTPSPPCASFST
mmetsp:Transcript_30396/g.80799  ORF Transcript_30396/g.80799 Transcript_30396/m.80799 type:complete len:307 (-) Transcript_30396:1073-1993(-)